MTAGVVADAGVPVPVWLARRVYCVWDNRVTHPCAASDSCPAVRSMERVMISGVLPFFRDADSRIHRSRLGQPAKAL